MMMMTRSSPHSLPFNFYNVTSENLVLDQLIIPLVDIFLHSYHLPACINFA